MSKIKTTGDLREFLCYVINGVANGSIDPDKAKNITKLAAQVNSSFYTEINVAKTLSEVGKKSAALGTLPISDCGETK